MFTYVKENTRGNTFRSLPGNTWTARKCSDGRALYIGGSVTGAVSYRSLAGNA
jgi:hypothetical protein